MTAVAPLAQLPAISFHPAALDAAQANTQAMLHAYSHKPQGRRHGRRGGKAKTCFACGEAGHVKRECPTARTAPLPQHGVISCDIMSLAPTMLAQQQLYHTPLTSLAVPQMCPGSPSTIGRTSSWASLDSYAESYTTDMSMVTVSTSGLAPVPVTPPAHVAPQHIAPPASPLPVQPVQAPSTNANGFFIAKPGVLLNGRYSVINQIGKGTFATVVSAEDLTTGEQVAIKIVRAEKSALADAEDEAAIMTEITQAFANSPNVESASAGLVLLTDSFHHGKHKCMVQPLCGPSLFAGLQGCGFTGMPVGQVLRVTQSMIAAVLKFHLLGFIHCDLKPENILLNAPSTSLCTLVDYGCSYRDTDRKPRLIQTLYYRAPEIVLSNYWSFPVDMWSVGCIVYELLSGQPLFQIEGDMSHIHVIEQTVEECVPPSLVQRCPNDALVDQATQSLRPPKVATEVVPLRKRLQDMNVPVELQDLLAGLLRVDPQQRLKAHEALQHHAFAML